MGALIAVAFAAHMPAHAQSPTSPLAELNKLATWLASSPHGAGWRSYLKLDELRSDFGDDGTADWVRVARTIDALSSDVPGLERKPFVEARQALRSWFDAQTAWPLEALPHVIEQAKDQFAPVAPQEVERRRERLLATMNAWERFLGPAGQTRQAAWKNYLRWDELRRELAKPNGPDPAVLRDVLDRLGRPEPGLELAPFVAVRQALRQYYNGVLTLANPHLEQTYRAALDVFKSRVESYVAQPTTDTASQIGEGLGFLQDIGQAPHVVAGVRRHFAEPNLRIALSQGLLAAGVERTVDEPTQVREVILGTNVRGFGRTRGQIRLTLAPNDEQATLVLNLTAQANTQNVGVNGPATIYSTGATDIRATHAVHFNDVGVIAGDVLAQACVHTNIYGIAARLRIVERIAWRRARASLSQAEAIASSRATARAREQFAQQVREQLVQANANFQEKFLAPMKRWQVEPESLRFSTTQTHLRVAARHATERQLASPTPSPPDVGGDLSIRVHESAVGNFSESALAGRTYGPDDFQRLAEESPLGAQDSSDLQLDRNWSITFRERHPVAAEFRDGKATLRVALAGFMNEGRALNYDMIAIATYEIVTSTDGPKLVRQGGVEIAWPDRRPPTVQRLVYQEKFRDRFAALFRPELFVRDLAPEDAPPGFGVLRDFALRSEGGWFTVGFRRLTRN